MDTGLGEQVIVLTGASGGIGRACARLLASEGARLVLHGRTQGPALEQLAATLTSPSRVCTGDLTREADVDALFAAAERAFGRVDGVVTSAGIWPAEPTPVHRMDLARWRQVIDTNLTAVFLCARRFFLHLATRRPDEAALVLVGSTAARFGEESHAAYAASKAGLTYGLTLTLKNEIVRLSPRGRVNAVCPGWTRTPMAAPGLAEAGALDRTLQTRSIRRIAEPEDVAAAVAFLLSPVLAAHVSGEILTVAGGMEGRLLHAAGEAERTQGEPR